MGKVSMKLFTEVLRSEYENRMIKMTTKSVFLAPPLVRLTPEQEKTLNDGDGQVPDQYKQINSSTGLAVNYYKILEGLGLISDLIFENKIARPLNKGGRCANLDVSYKKDNVIYFVESKFLEPYYSSNETIKESYLDVSKYPIEVKTHHEEWHKLFQESQEFKYYNFSQLCRHLLAIYRYTHGIKDSNYQGEHVVLQCVTWKMPTNSWRSLRSPIVKKWRKERKNSRKKLKNAKITSIHLSRK